MSKEREGCLLRILFWPMFSMEKSIEEIHAAMDEEAHGDAFLGENKRAIGVAGALGGCIGTLMWWAVLLIVLIVAIVLFVIWIL